MGYLGLRKASSPLLLGPLSSWFLVGLLVAVTAGAMARDRSPSTRPVSPTKVDPVAEQIAAGWDALELVNFPKAHKAFQAVLRSNPTPAQKAEALFALGHLWQYRQNGADLDRARELYEQVVRELANTPAGPLAMLALARMADAPPYEKDRRIEDARKLYRKIINRYGDRFVAHEAVLRLAMTYLERRGDRASEDAGAKILRDHLAKHAKNFLGIVMRSQLAELHFSRREYRQAVEQWIAVETLDAAAGKNRAMSPLARSGLYFRIAKVSEKHLKDYAAAAKWYTKLVTEVPRENRYYLAKISAARCRKLSASATTKPADRGGPGR